MKIKQTNKQTNKQKRCSCKTAMDAGKLENSHFSFTFFSKYWKICLKFYVKSEYFTNDKCKFNVNLSGRSCNLSFRLKINLRIIVAKIIKKFVSANIRATAKLVRKTGHIRWDEHKQIIKKKNYLKENKSNIFILLIICNALEYSWHRNILEAYFIKQQNVA